MLNNFLNASWNAPKNIKTLITTSFPPSTTAIHKSTNRSRIQYLGSNKSMSGMTHAAVIPATALVPNQALGFNLATHVGDDINIVMRNRQILKQFLPSVPYWLLQTHSNNVLDVDKIITPLAEYKDYDAAITFTKNTVCVVLTADCIPIFLTDTSGNFVASIHAGRVGVAKNIIQNTIAKSNVTSNKILAYIAPAICQKHYEVGSDILSEFDKLDHRYKKFFQKKSIADKFDLDLNGIAVLQLLDSGVLPNNIYQSGICTFCSSDKFYSYRKNKNTGRFASCIWITD